MAKLTIKDITECTEWKTCTKCDEEKKVVFFSKSGDNFRPECKACDKKYRNDKKVSVKDLTWYDKLINWLF